jgi:hypothetical protein
MIFMASAIGFIQGLGSLYNTYNAYENAKNANVLSSGDALARAQASLDPLYNKKVTGAVTNLDNASARRGFYGQAAADQLKSNTIADIRADQASGVANLASQLQGQSAQNAAVLQSQFTNSLNGLGNIRQNMINNGQGNGVWNWLLNLGKNAGSVSGGIGGNMVMDNSGNIGYSTPQYGLGSGINPNFLKTDFYG